MLKMSLHKNPCRTFNDLEFDPLGLAYDLISNLTVALPFSSGYQLNLFSVNVPEINVKLNEINNNLNKQGKSA